MRVGAVQFDIVWRDPAANLAVVDGWAAAAAAQGVDLLVLPEMFTTGFSMEADRIAEPDGGRDSITAMTELARRHRLRLAGSLAVVGAERPPVARNRFVLVGPDGLEAHYDKRHPFSFAGEHHHFGPGDDLVTVTVEGLRVTPFICYDLRFADDFWTTGPATDVFVVPANWPAARAAHWRALLRARAIENQCYVVGVNRVGEVEGLEHRGDSCIIDPLGETLVEAAGTEALVVADVSAARVAAVRQSFRVLDDRRPVDRRPAAAPDRGPVAGPDR